MEAPFTLVVPLPERTRRALGAAAS